jgi:hypothetical protein
MTVALVGTLGGAQKTLSALTAYPFTVTTPGSGNVVLVAVNTRRTSAAAAPSSLSGLGLTWTKVDGAAEAGSIMYTSVWVGVGTPSGTTLTVNFAAAPQYCAIQPSEWSGVDTTTPIVQSLPGTVTSGPGLTLTLTNPPTSGAVYGAVGHRANEGTTPGTSWTELLDDNSSTPASFGFETNYRLANDQDCDWAWATSQNGVGVILELKAGGGGAVTTGGVVKLGMRSRAGASTARTDGGRVKVGARERAGATSARAASPRSRAGLRLVAGESTARTSTPRVRLGAREKAAATTTRVALPRLRAGVRTGGGASTSRVAAPIVRLGARGHAGASTMRTAGGRLRAGLRARASTGALQVFTGGRVVLGLRSRASAATSRPAAPRVRVGARERATASTVRPAAPRVRAGVRGRVSISTQRTSMPRTLVALRARASASTSRAAGGRVRLGARVRAGQALQRVTGGLIRLGLRVRAAVGRPSVVVPREPFSSSAVRTGQRMSTADRSGAYHSASAVDGERSSDR